MTKKADIEQVSVNLPRLTKRRVLALSRQEGITLAAWIRRLVMQATKEPVAP